MRDAAIHRCNLCALPLDEPGRTGYCSERCLLWSVFGVPALKEDALITEMLTNQRVRSVPDGWVPPPAYPELDQFSMFPAAKAALVRAAATLQISRSHNSVLDAQ